MKGFDLAYPSDAYTGQDDGMHIRGAEITQAEKDAWARPRHPRKGDSVRLLDSYPLLPDWDALPQGQPGEMPIPPAYATFKFITNPVGATDTYDERLDVAILRQRAVPEEEMAKSLERENAYRKDPVNNQRYIPKAEYTFFLPDDSVSVRGVKRKFDVLDPEKDEDALYGGADDEDDDLGLGEAKTGFRYNNVRVYETYQQRGNTDDVFECVALALHDPGADGSTLEKGAYFYPVLQQSNIRQKGKKFDPRLGTAAEVDEQEEDRIDAIEVKVREFDEDEMEQLAAERAVYEASE